MSQTGDWTPDEPQGTEVFEQGDEALDEASRLDPEMTEDVQLDPTLDPTLQVDERELEEVGAEFDDPEGMVTLQGGLDDPDGLGGPTNRARAEREDDEGWDLDGSDGDASATETDSIE